MSTNLGKIVNSETGEVLVEMIGPPNARSSGDELSKGLYALSELVIRGLKPEEGGGGLGGEFGYACDFENDIFRLYPDYQDEECSCGFRQIADQWHEENPHSADCFQVVALERVKQWESNHPDTHYKKRWKQERIIARGLCRERKLAIQDSIWHCDCGQQERCSAWFTEHNHATSCVLEIPNFLHKPSGLTVNWYKWIGRSMEVNKPEMTIGEWANILKECYESIPLEARERAEAESKADAEREADSEYQKAQQEMFNSMFQAMRDIHDTCEREGHDDATGHCKRCGLITNFERGFASFGPES